MLTLYTFTDGRRSLYSTPDSSSMTPTLRKPLLPDPPTPPPPSLSSKLGKRSVRYLFPITFARLWNCFNLKLRWRADQRMASETRLRGMRGVSSSPSRWGRRKKRMPYVVRRICRCSRRRNASRSKPSSYSQQPATCVPIPSISHQPQKTSTPCTCSHSLPRSQVSDTTTTPRSDPLLLCHHISSNGWLLLRGWKKHPHHCEMIIVCSVTECTDYEWEWKGDYVGYGKTRVDVLFVQETS